MTDYPHLLFVVHLVFTFFNVFHLICHFFSGFLRAMNFYRLILSVALLLCAFIGNAQHGCYDPLLVNENSYCNPDFEPVCGCDGITYKNECFARNYNGISSSTYGPCSQVAFELRPNPVQDFVEIEIVLRYKSNAQILIYNMQGHLQYRRILQDLDHFSQRLTVTNLNNGLYLVVVESGGVYSYQRFLKL